MLLTGIIICVFCCLAGICVFLSDFFKHRRCNAKAAAVILDVREEDHWSNGSGRARRRTYYYPVIAFSTPEGTIRAKTNLKGYRPETYQIGERLNIRYNPQNPYDLKLERNTLWESAVGMGFFFLLGGVILCLCLRAG